MQIPRQPSQFLLAVLILAVHSIAMQAEEATDFDFFEKKIRPVLVQHCYECHAVESKTIRGGLLLDSRESMRDGGDSGAGIEPGNPENSLVLQALRYESFEMPPRGPLSDEVIRDFETWILNGAADPRDATTTVTRQSIDIEAGKQFWCFQPRRKVKLPTVEEAAWPESTVDVFIKSQLEAEQIQSVADADRATLLRRAYFALIGLPPDVDEISKFQADEDPTPVAFAKVVDRLLESHHFGERWGRHWLDVVRFAESSGGGRTLLFPDAWRYRDYVIDAFNADMPFDQFVREQIAGDLLAKEVSQADWQTRRRLLTATSFLLLGPTNYELQDKDILEMDIVDEQLDTIGKAFLGMTIGCARCHDHKFDPIPTHDYYAMAGILKGTKSVIHSNVSTWNTSKLPVPPEQRDALLQHETRLKKMQADLAEAKEAKKRADQDEDEAASKLLSAQIKQLEKTVGQVRAQGPAWPQAMATQDDEAATDIPIAIRGMVHNPGELVRRGVLRVASSREFPRLAKGSSGRREFAEWLADDQNPLTARVIVNRVWHWLFGRGIVSTVDNFGAMGSLPSHPELLDHLASEFVEDGQSIKRLIRRLMLSHVYRLSSNGSLDEFAHEQDRSNRLLWRMNRRRMEAESIRDTLLQLAGTLDSRQGGANIKSGTKIEYDYEFDSTRRSVYVPVFRNTLPGLFATFDFADPNIQMGKRTSSTISPQALLLMNDPFVMEQCDAAGRRMASWETDRDASINLCFQEVLSRNPTTAEHSMAAKFLAEGNDARSWSLLVQTLVQSIDFRYIK